MSCPNVTEDQRKCSGVSLFSDDSRTDEREEPFPCGQTDDATKSKPDRLCDIGSEQRPHAEARLYVSLVTSQFLPHDVFTSTCETWQWWRSYCLHLDQRLKRKEVTRSQWTAPCRRTDHTKWRGCSTGKKWTVTTIWGCRSLSASPLWTHAPLMAFTCQSSLFELRAAAVHLQSSAFEWERERVQMFKVK